MDAIGIYREEDAHLDVINRLTVCPERILKTVTPKHSSRNLENIYNSKSNFFVISSLDDQLIPPYAELLVTEKINSVLMTVPLSKVSVGTL